jgi:hypothetical protein
MPGYARLADAAERDGAFDARRLPERQSARIGKAAQSS